MTKGKLKDRAAARGEVSVVVFETGQMVTTDARARPRSDRLDPAVFAVVRVQWRHPALAFTHARGAIPPIVAPNPAVTASHLEHNELWSYRIANGTLLPTRYGTSSDVQLWSATDLAVQYALAILPR